MSSATNAEDPLKRIAAGERDLQGANLFGANLRGVDLKGSNLRGANLRGANLSGADLRDSRLARTDLGVADLSAADFSASDLSGADFRGANLKGALFGGATMDGANLRGADLYGANLKSAKLVRADLSRADLRGADLGRADLRAVDLSGADLSGASLREASLMSATLPGANLRGADLSGANLRAANLADARLDDAVLKGATVGGTVFADLDLRRVLGLETLVHWSPSTVGADTLSRSQGRIPESFLRGCGLSPWEVLTARQYDPALTSPEMDELPRWILAARMQASLPRKSILISYSGVDAPFVEELRRRLMDRGLFSWVAIHESKGAVRERQTKLAIDHDVILLLVLSTFSVRSDWVEHELKLARRLEASLDERILVPISLDEIWRTSPWQSRPAERIPEADVLSFSRWQESGAMEARFAELLAAIGRSTSR